MYHFQKLRLYNYLTHWYEVWTDILVSQWICAIPIPNLTCSRLTSALICAEIKLNLNMEDHDLLLRGKKANNLFMVTETGKGRGTPWKYEEVMILQSSFTVADVCLCLYCYDVQLIQYLINHFKEYKRLIIN